MLSRSSKNSEIHAARQARAQLLPQAGAGSGLAAWEKDLAELAQMVA